MGSRGGRSASTGRALRAAIIAACRAMEARGLTQGTSGNVSVRHGGDMLITPSATAYDALRPEMIAAMAIADNEAGEWQGPLKPSSEWRFHRDILATRPEVGAVVHTHSPHATALAMTRRAIPAGHYMVAAFGGNDVRCAGYARFGTAALSGLVIEALRDRKACLMANHGAITLGRDLDEALSLAIELEALARQHVLALAVGGPVILGATEMAEVHAAFAGYRKT